MTRYIACVTGDPHPMQNDDPVEKARRQWVASGKPDESGFTVVVSMLRTYGLMIRELERALKPVGLTLSRYEVLLLLSFTKDARLPIMRLRDLLMIHGSSATYLVDKLVDAGWIERQADPTDRRVSIVQLTPAGRRQMEKGTTALVATGFGAVGDLSDTERRALAALLAAMRGAESPDIIGV